MSRAPVVTPRPPPTAFLPRSGGPAPGGPDAFWGQAAAPRLPRWGGAAFWGPPHAQRPVDVAAWTGSTRARFAWSALLLGFLGIVGNQIPYPQHPVAFLWLLPLPQMLLVVIALVAPVFEEAFKFGLALALVAGLAAGRARGVVLALRIAVAWAVGVSFGLAEHAFIYSDESDLAFLLRVLFHGLATGLSMSAFSILEGRVAPARVWLCLAPAAFFHYAGNAGGVMLAPTGWAVVHFAVVVVATGLASLALPYLARRLVRRVERGNAPRRAPTPH